MKKAPLIVAKRLPNRAPSNGTDSETRQLLSALMAFKRGDFSARLPEDWTGVPGKIADTFNAVIETNQRMARELERIVHAVGKEGRISQRASIGEVSGSWADVIQCMNVLIGDLVRPTSEMARVIGAVAKGDLSETMATEIEGIKMAVACCTGGPGPLDIVWLVDLLDPCDRGRLWSDAFEIGEPGLFLQMIHGYR